MAICASCLFSLSLVIQPADSDDYREAVAAVERATVEINTDPDQGIVALRAALAELHQHAPQLAADPAALEQRTMAELALARALLASGDHEGAAAAVDAALGGLADSQLPIERLGPSLTGLVAERRQVLASQAEAGLARLHVACSIPCEVYVDERSSDADQADGVALPLGQHRLWIASDQAPPVRTTVSFDEPDMTLTLAYPDHTELAPTLIDPPLSPAQARRLQPRAAPRWVEVTTLVVGAAAAAAGAVLWAIDSGCPRGVDPRDGASCPELYDTRTAGIALVSAGAAAALTGGVMLIVDEARLPTLNGERRGREASLVWTVKF